ncbi:unnamed protein product [Linum tenue]|uniref:GAG1At protein n=2 Tax=Linum TaxID=4005 RepID=A0AAV0KKF7_9ROSI|nr:unnamed protein product [Linum tenue]
MGSESKSSGNTAPNGGGGGGFKSRLEHAMYSGDKKHVLAGIAVISVIFGIPWYLMNRGSKHQSHQDYMDKADRARKARLSSGSSAS